MTTHSEKEIQNMFEAFGLGTESQREKFLALQRLVRGKPSSDDLYTLQYDRSSVRQEDLQDA